MINMILDDTKERMTKTIEAFEKTLTTVRTGRANASLISGIEAEYYGMMTPINQMAGVTVQEGKTVVIKPYDNSALKNIEKAILASNLGITPNNDGTVIRLTVPALTEETRRDLSKQVGKYAEDAKIQIRNIRRDSNDDAKAAKKEDELTEDQEKQCLEKIQKVTDEFVKKIDVLADEKVKEIMTI